MAQQASPEPITLEPPATLLNADPSIVETDPTAVVESYADSLMDELFDDVDRILAGDDNRKVTVEYTESASTDPFISEARESSSALVPAPAALDVKSDSALDATPSALATKSSEESKRRFRLGKTLDRLLVGAAGASLVFTGVFWVSQQRKSEPWVTTQPEAAMTPEALKAEADAQFLKYLARSLEVIDNQIQASQAASTASTASLPTVTVNPVNLGQANGGILPSNGALGGASILSNNRPNVIERVYIPVYQPPSTQTLAAALSNPSVSSATPSAAAGSIPNIAPASVHVLVGVLELGDRSAALFEINGTPQRFYIGENISTSGWTLVSVANQEAVIRRNGEVRSVYVGQQF